MAMYVLNTYTYECETVLFNSFFFCQVIIKMFLEKRFSFTNISQLDQKKSLQIERLLRDNINEQLIRAYIVMINFYIRRFNLFF